MLDDLNIQPPTKLNPSFRSVILEHLSVILEHFSVMLVSIWVYFFNLEGHFFCEKRLKRFLRLKRKKMIAAAAAAAAAAAIWLCHMALPYGFAIWLCHIQDFG